ncbi:MAG: protein-export membrane protein SecF [Gallionellaceae bacterium CG1_02_56_997]|nr:MAG: protein-export membrane protein SecF [Gallionellaceae bacterium CG1_02_56_997]HCJ50707.1 protein translocase subunit SecF [Gallionella sp.]
MEFFKIKHDIPFMSYGRYTTAISLVTFLFAVFFLATKGLNFGVDFTGGTVLEVHYAQPADLVKVRQQLAAGNLPDAQVQNFGSSHDVLIQIPLKENFSGAQLSEHVMEALHQQDASVEMRRVEFVGPQVGKDLVENGAMALLLVSLGIIGYLWIRFEWKFGLSAIIANLHDVVIILGFFAFFQWEFSLSVLAAVLAVLGYSVNESVVVFDRIRENFRKMRRAEVHEIIDNAITRTMSRTIITHGSTQMMVGAMLFMGGETLHYFAMALTIGILFSIYSSVLVASPILMWLGVSREDFIKPEKVEAEEVLP